MKTVKALVLVGCLVPILAGSARAEKADAIPAAAKMRIGTYDSRAIAVAYVGSKPFGKWLAALTAEQAKAKAAGNQKRGDELEAEGIARQKLLHTQGFSTAPVDNILAQIKDMLPAVKEKDDVTDLLSKWDKAALAKHKDAELVDVTMSIVDLLAPTNRQRQRAIEIQKHDPITLKQAENIKD